MTILGLHHLAIICSDYSRSKHFYTEILGLPIISEFYRSERQSYKLDLSLHDGTQIELFSFPDPPSRPSHPESCGLRHLAFRVQNIDQEISDLTVKGIDVEPLRVDPLTGRRFTFFADPDDLPVELYEETEAVEVHF